ncbi:MAG: hypothetical protein HY926_03265 [Elusimicrobia bacterium]|nr:hypothetical protein [Elusimicrobiota bacterium]
MRSSLFLLLLASRAWPASTDTPAALPGSAAFLAARPGRAALRRAVESALPAAFPEDLAVRGTRLFQLERAGPDRRARITMRPRSLTEPLLVVDESRMGPDASLAWWRPSPDGLLLAYGVRDGRTGTVELRLRPAGAGEDLPDRIPRVPDGALAWLPDRTGFYYVRLAAAAPQGAQLLFHTLGMDPSRDVPAASTAAAQGLLDAQVSPDGGLLALSVRRAPGRCETLVLDRADPGAAPAPLPAGPQCAGRMLFDGQVLHLLFREAPPRLLSFDLRKPAKPQRRETVLTAPLPARDAVLLRGGLAVLSREAGVSRLQLRGRDGLATREIAAPGPGSVTALAADPARGEVFFVWQSLFAPPVLCRYDAGAASTAVLTPGFTRDQERFRLRRVEFAAPDGSLRGLLLASHPRLKRDGANPAVLSALPAAGPDALPAYSPMLVSWLESGGLWAAVEGPIDAAVLAEAGRWLTAQEYSRPDRIALLGAAEPGRFAASVWARPDGTALLRWPPDGRAELGRAPYLDRAADIQAFLLWRMGLEPEAPPPKEKPAEKKPPAPKTPEKKKP